jgi:hypothetical protein
LKFRLLPGDLLRDSARKLFFLLRIFVFFPMRFLIPSPVSFSFCWAGDEFHAYPTQVPLLHKILHARPA